MTLKIQRIAIYSGSNLKGPEEIYEDWAKSRQIRPKIRWKNCQGESRDFEPFWRVERSEFRFGRTSESRACKCC